MDTTFKLSEASVYVTHGSCKRGDLPPQESSDPEGYRDVDRCEREQITVTVERRPYALVPDLCWELDRKLSWAEFGATVVPADSCPLGVLSESSAQHVAGAVIISVDPNQSQGEYGSSSFEPDVSEVRLLLTQPISSALADMELLIARRNDLLDVLGPLTGVLRGATPPVPEPHVFKGRPWGTAWSESWGPLFP